MLPRTHPPAALALVMSATFLAHGPSPHADTPACPPTPLVTAAATTLARPPADTGLFGKASILGISVSTDLRRLLNRRDELASIPAVVEISEDGGWHCRLQAGIRARGHYRLENCLLPPLLLEIPKSEGPCRAAKGRVKIVIPCREGTTYQSLVMKEYLVYRLYGLFTEAGFRVRLLDLRLSDANGLRKPLQLKAFMIEDVDAMARRNAAFEWRPPADAEIVPDRRNGTLLGIFQFMVGNTDWNVSRSHNIRFIKPRGDTSAPPVAVPYDFDYCGLVNAPYAVPNEVLGISGIRERKFMGYPRTMMETEAMIARFHEARNDMMRAIDECPFLEGYERKDVKSYIDDFFEEVSDPRARNHHFLHPFAR